MDNNADGTLQEEKDPEERKLLGKLDSTLYTPCARRMLQDRVELRVLIGDILKENADAVAFPADPDLTFSSQRVESMFKISSNHLFQQYQLFPDRRVMKYDNLKLANVSKVYFCAIPTWMGGMKEREEFSSIINELFDLIRKDGIITLALCPLNKKMGSFPLSIMARLMIYYLDWWVKQYMDDKTFRISSINIVCSNHPTVSW